MAVVNGIFWLQHKYVRPALTILGIVEHSIK